MFGSFHASSAAVMYKGDSTNYRGDGITSKCAVYLGGFIGVQQQDEVGRDKARRRAGIKH